MATVSDIPELVKAMFSLFGEKWGKRIGRAIVIFILCTAAGAAVAAIMAGVKAVTSWISSSPTISSISLAVLGSLLTLCLVIGIAVALGSFFGMMIRIGLATPLQRNINSLLGQTEALLIEVKQGGLQDTQRLGKLLSDLEVLKEEWHTSRITKFTQWISGRKPEKRPKNE